MMLLHFLITRMQIIQLEVMHELRGEWLARLWFVLVAAEREFYATLRLIA